MVYQWAVIKVWRQAHQPLNQNDFRQITELYWAKYIHGMYYVLNTRNNFERLKGSSALKNHTETDCKVGGLLAGVERC